MAKTKLGGLKSCLEHKDDCATAKFFCRQVSAAVKRCGCLNNCAHKDMSSADFIALSQLLNIALKKLRELDKYTFAYTTSKLFILFGNLCLHTNMWFLFTNDPTLEVWKNYNKIFHIRIFSSDKLVLSQHLFQ